MADTISTAPQSLHSNHGFAHMLFAPFRVIGMGLIAMAEAGPRMQEVRKLNALSDEELAARGTTRMDEVHRIFSVSMYV